MIFPIGDENIEGGAKPIFSYLFIAINVLIFFYQASLGMEGYKAFLYEYGTIPLEIVNGEDYFTIFTNMFLHGDLMHLAWNMLFLWIFADNIEAVVGNANFVVFYILGGVIASLAHIFFNVGSSIPAVGASGAISAVMGAYVVMFPKSKIKMWVFIIFKTFYISAVFFLVFWFAQQLWGVFTSMGSEQTSGTAWWAHIGGFVFGLLAGYIAKQSFDLEQYHRPPIDRV